MPQEAGPCNDGGGTPPPRITFRSGPWRSLCSQRPAPCNDGGGTPPPQITFHSGPRRSFCPRRPAPVTREGVPPHPELHFDLAKRMAPKNSDADPIGPRRCAHFEHDDVAAIPCVWPTALWDGIARARRQCVLRLDGRLQNEFWYQLAPRRSIHFPPLLSIRNLPYDAHTSNSFERSRADHKKQVETFAKTKG